MIKCFEANYPESLGTVLVHKAPWIFQGIWKIIRNWLDPVVANKVHFTNSVTELSEFIEPSSILAELGGDNSWKYSYVEPAENENDRMKDAETKGKLISQRKDLAREYEEEVFEWLATDKGEKEDWSTSRAKRDGLAAQLRRNYWELDPYVRARSVYDRNGELESGASRPPTAVAVPTVADAVAVPAANTAPATDVPVPVVPSA
jgi:CRAL/TRIO domain